MSRFPLCLILLFVSGPLFADEIRVAVASNFSAAMKALAEQFELASEHQLILSFGSTGKHYAQIINGAPFDAFFAADSRRPELLEKNGQAMSGSRFTYARGKLVLWSGRPGYVDSQGQVLNRGDYRHLSIANPKLAPYGVAAREILQTLGLWNELQSRMVRGENIGQAYQFVKSGNAELGFIARSQLTRAESGIEGSLWQPPQALYTPIEQQAVKLTDNEIVDELMAFVRSEAGMEIIREYGYDTF